MQTYSIYILEKKIGTIRISSQEDINEEDIIILDPILYGKIKSFNQ
jgi:hypothetical protein